MTFDLTLTNGDLKIGSNGDLEPVFNEHKLIQDILKSIFTPTGSHKLHTWYGSPLLDNTLGNSIDRNILNTIINNGVFYALSNIQILQSAQISDGQYLTPKEILKSIDDVIIIEDEVDLRKLSVIVRVTTRSGSNIEEAFTINLWGINDY